MFQLIMNKIMRNIEKEIKYYNIKLDLLRDLLLDKKYNLYNKPSLYYFIKCLSNVIDDKKEIQKKHESKYKFLITSFVLPCLLLLCDYYIINNQNPFLECLSCLVIFSILVIIVYSIIDVKNLIFEPSYIKMQSLVLELEDLYNRDFI